MGDVAISSRLKDNYDTYYDGSPSAWRALGAIDKVKNILTLCRGVPHSTILDIGSGDGALLKRLSDLKFGDRLLCVEVSRSAVATINERRLPQVSECQLFDGYHLPFENQSVDLAILSHVLEHVEHPRKLLQEAARVAQNVFVEVPLEDNLRLGPDYVFNRVGHINFYSWKTVRLLAQTCDLEVVAQNVSNPSREVYRYYGMSAATLRHGIKELLLKTSEPLATRLFTYHCSMLCRKIPS